MSDVLDFCERATIEARTRDGIKKVPAWRYEQFAVHQAIGRNVSDLWSITHLATGLGMTRASGVYSQIENAVAAMMEIQQLRNDWSGFKAQDYEGELPSLKEAIDAVRIKHGGELIGFSPNTEPLWLAAPLNGISTHTGNPNE